MATFNAPQINITTELRPCWVRDKKALFHRWVDTARPVKPKGMEDDENTEYYQLSNCHGLVEFEDGTVARVWPQEIRFADIREEFLDQDWGVPFTFEETKDQEAAHGDN